MTTQTRESLTHRLSQAITDRQKMMDEMDCAIQALKDAIAEAEKPKLRHGDYGLWRLHKNDPWVFAIYINLGDTPDTMFYHNGMCCSQASKQNMTTLGEFRKEGNIFDDLKAISERVTQVKANGVLFTMDSSGGINIDPAPGRSMFHVEEKAVDEFVMDIRRLVQTERTKDGPTEQG